MITGPEAGITRDCDQRSTGSGRASPVRLVDTAGLRKRAKVDDKLEKLSAADTRRAIDHAEVVVLLLDATRGLEAQDLQIADQVIEEGRALVIALNKWDVAEHASSLFNGVKAALEEGLSQLKGVPVLTDLGEDRQGHRPVLEGRLRAARKLVAASSDRRAQPLVRGAVEANPPPAPERQADQAALHHPGEDAAAELRRVRDPGRPAARQLSALSAEFDAARPEARAGAAAPDLPRAEEPVRHERPLSLILPFRVRHAGGPRLTVAHGSNAMSDDDSDIVDWVHFEKSRAELGAGLHPHPELFPRGRRQVGRRRSKQAMHDAEHGRAGHPRAHDQGRSAPVRRRAAGADRRADREHRALCVETHRFPDELVPEVVELRRLFSRTVDLFDKATNPLLSRARRTAASAARSATRTSAGSRLPPARCRQRLSASAAVPSAPGCATAIRTGRSGSGRAMASTRAA